MLEVWKPVVGCEKRYLISNQGRVKSLLRSKVLRPALCGIMRNRRTVWLSVNGKVKIRLVAHLVSEAFLGPKPDKLHVLHKNDVSIDDRADNLYYGTHVQNMADRTTNGWSGRGANNSSVKLMDNQVREIRKLLAAGELQRVLAKGFDVTRETISDIKRGKSWGWLT